MLFSVLVSGVHVGNFPLMSDNHCSHKIHSEAVKTDRQFGHCGSFSTYANWLGCSTGLPPRSASLGIFLEKISPVSGFEYLHVADSGQ